MLQIYLNKKPPDDGLVHVFENIYVFDSCFRTQTWEEKEYRAYVNNTITRFKETHPQSLVMIMNFREGDTISKINLILSEHFITIMDYAKHYQGSPLLSVEGIHNFLETSESWFSLGREYVLLVHSEVGGWPVLAFMVAALLIHRKHFTSANKALQMVYKKAPPDNKYPLMSGLDSVPSQLRYLKYVLKSNADEQWPPEDKPLTLDSVIMPMIPDFNGKGGCRPVFRIFGRDPLLLVDKTPKLLFSTPRWNRKNVPSYNQAESELVRIDINCRIQGDIVLECYSLHDDMVNEHLMYRFMFNTSFIKSSILVLNRDEIDVCWDAKYKFPRGFEFELLFSEMDVATSISEEEVLLPLEAFTDMYYTTRKQVRDVPQAHVALQMEMELVQEQVEELMWRFGNQPGNPPNLF